MRRTREPAARQQQLRSAGTSTEARRRVGNEGGSWRTYRREDQTLHVSPAKLKATREVLALLADNLDRHADSETLTDQATSA